MLNPNLQDKSSVLRDQEKNKDSWHIRIHTTTKWKWAGHIARRKDSRWTKRCTTWQTNKGGDQGDDQADDFSIQHSKRVKGRGGGGGGTRFAALLNCSGVCFHFYCVLPFRCLKFDIFICIVSPSSFWCLFMKIISRKRSLWLAFFVDSCVPVKHCTVFVQCTDLPFCNLLCSSTVTACLC